MMGIVKGCINPKCVANQKRIAYKKADNSCAKCGNKLYYVCRKCYTQLPDDSKKYCVRCLAGKKDRKDSIKDNVLKIGGVLATFAVIAVGPGKNVIATFFKRK
jgi:hypothetical protein